MRTHQSLQRDELTAQRTLISCRVALYRAIAEGWMGEMQATHSPEN